MSLIDLWIATLFQCGWKGKHDKWCEIDKRDVRNSKGYRLFCMLCSVAHWWMWRNIFSVFYQVCVFSHRYRLNMPWNCFFILCLRGISFETSQNLQGSWFVFCRLNVVLCYNSSEVCRMMLDTLTWNTPVLGKVCNIHEWLDMLCVCVCETKSHPRYFHQHWLMIIIKSLGL